MAMTEGTLGVVSIATNEYLDFWKTLAYSIDQNIGNSAPLKIYLFTDQVSSASAFASTLQHLEVKVSGIPSYGWPDATLLRYRIISEVSDSWYDSDVLLYLDADMLVVSELDTESILLSGDKGMNLVAHPGFYRGDTLPVAARFRLASTNLKALIHDAFLLVTQGGLGFWENRRASRAYLARRLRKKYFCGGVWWGKKSDFLNFCRELAADVDLDSDQGITAIWHDESHLNRWAGDNHHIIRPPTYCYVPTYPWLEQLLPVIEAVDKGSFDRTSP